MILNHWKAHVIDVQGAFLNGRFSENEELYLKIPEGFERYYEKNNVLKLNRTIYGLKQAANAFWKELLNAFSNMNFKRSNADPCLYYRHDNNELTLCLSWVDDCLIIGKENAVIETKNKLKEYFECDDLGEATEYVGCALKYDNQHDSLTMTQPILVKSLKDEFIENVMKVETPAAPGIILKYLDDESEMADENSTKIYRSGVGYYT